MPAGRGPRKARPTSDEIRRFILVKVSDGDSDLVSKVADEFSISRQAVHQHVKRLIADGALIAAGRTRKRRYQLGASDTRRFELPLAGLEEDVVWRERIASFFKNRPENVRDIWHYGFSEMINNAIDHSGGKTLRISLEANALLSEGIVVDDGVGIFRKIARDCGLNDERHALLELSKGKLTTDPARHTGEGIFFTSRMMDGFAILSGDVSYLHDVDDDGDWILEANRPREGTAVFMRLANDSTRVEREVFSKFSSKDGDYGFTKTVVPVRLAKEGEERLISRSQGKRLMARVDRFGVVLLDFAGIERIGPAFADEVFRVFPRMHPQVEIHEIRTVGEVQKMIERARKGGPAGALGEGTEEGPVRTDPVAE